MLFTKLSALTALQLLSLPAAQAQTDPNNNASAPTTVPFFTCNPGYPVSSAEQSIIFTNFLRKFYIEKDVYRAGGEHILPNAINHNPNVNGDRDASLAWVAPLIAEWNVTITNTGFADNVGWSHVKVEGPGMGRYTVAVDIWRFEGGCVAEHWDALQVAPPANRTNPLELI
ncbi:uncharacterized protein CCOS01_07095 [Colletotrichum costaricense]|uniref:SnoaL-like domain-containing protein n=1 Tax=Colletotrichum costaricense TaxID=1209916 RepID=A0AAI9YZQ4_9PEZI|nr:uncharacterized protein CCOS01_07095 [Colletotrichum costaricense]KAK1529261.1 hypothetical protein CCOS01_07095 [Colletotrichum costaricense]